jgi:hypothetical protein
MQTIVKDLARMQVLEAQTKLEISFDDYGLSRLEQLAKTELAQHFKSCTISEAYFYEQKTNIRSMGHIPNYANVEVVQEQVKWSDYLIEQCEENAGTVHSLLWPSNELLERFVTVLQSFPKLERIRCVPKPMRATVYTRQDGTPSFVSLNCRDTLSYEQHIWHIRPSIISLAQMARSNARKLVFANLKDLSFNIGEDYFNKHNEHEHPSLTTADAAKFLSQCPQLKTLDLFSPYADYQDVPKPCKDTGELLQALSTTPLQITTIQVSRLRIGASIMLAFVEAHRHTLEGVLSTEHTFVDNWLQEIDLQDQIRGILAPREVNICLDKWIIRW